MASSAKNKNMSSSYSHLQTSCEYGTTAAPPPTPLSSSQQLPNPTSNSSNSAAAADFLSGLLHRLPPSLSLPTRRPIPNNSPSSAISPPIISLTHHQTPNLLLLLLNASRETGFFQLTNHSIPSKLAQSAESESLSLFNLPPNQKQLLNFPTNTWPPLGFDFDFDDDDHHENQNPKLLCLDSASATDLSFNSIRDFISQMERLGLEVIQLLSQSLGFVNPVQTDPTRISSLLWVSEFTPSTRIYPYVVGLQYQIRSQKYSLQTGSNSGSVSVSPQIDSVLVSLGDIAKVWSNGEIKNVKGRPMPIIGDDKEDDQNRGCITMSLLLSVSLDSTVSPLLSIGKNVSVEEKDINKEELEENENEAALMKFNSFCFEDYAWRVYHERLSTKDPLDRYLI